MVLWMGLQIILLFALVKIIKIMLNFIKNLLKKKCYSIYCGEDWRAHIKHKYVPETGKCEIDCSNYKYEYNNECYSTCPEGATFCTPEHEKIETTNIVSTENKKEENPIATTEIVSTQKVEEGNDVETTNMITTEKIEDGNNLKTTENIRTNKLEVDNDISTANEVISDNNDEVNNDETKSYTDSSFLQYNNDISSSNSNTEDKKDDDKDSLTTFSYKENDIDKSDKDISTSLSLIKNSEDENNISDKSFIIKPYNLTGKNNEEIYQSIQNFMNSNILFDIKDSLMIDGRDNYAYQITTINNEKNILRGKNKNNNQFSTIDLGECENLLRNFYHIDRNVSLIIIKFEKIVDVSLERVLQYEIYEPFNKTKLDLSICDNTTIDVYTPVV